MSFRLPQASRQLPHWTARQPSSPRLLHVLREIEPILDFTETKMKKILTAIALSIALPAVAHAQAAPAPAPKGDCCEKMEKPCCCKDMDHSKMGHDMKPGADPHAGHDMSNAPAPSGHQH